jgi:hypothetical protein
LWYQQECPRLVAAEVEVAYLVLMEVVVWRWWWRGRGVAALGVR